MKMYRMVPDTIGFMFTKRYSYSEVKEDILYRLGYVAPEIYEYFGLYRNGMTSEQWTDSMFFFRSPWSCIRGMQMVREIYGTPFLARILEYDIPDEIVASSQEAFTNYEYFQAKGLLVPLNLLRDNNSLCTEIPVEIQEEFMRMGLEDIEEGLNAMASFIDSERHNRLREYFADEGQSIIEERMGNVAKYPFMQLDNASLTIFTSGVITKKTMLVTREDRELLNKIANGTASEEEVHALIDKSNGILTMENLGDYDFDRPFHRYGSIL